MFIIFRHLFALKGYVLVTFWLRFGYVFIEFLKCGVILREKTLDNKRWIYSGNDP